MKISLAILLILATVLPSTVTQRRGYRHHRRPRPPNSGGSAEPDADPEYPDPLIVVPKNNVPSGFTKLSDLPTGKTHILEDSVNEPGIQRMILTTEIPSRMVLAIPNNASTFGVTTSIIGIPKLLKAIYLRDITPDLRALKEPPPGQENVFRNVNNPGVGLIPAQSPPGMVLVFPKDPPDGVSLKPEYLVPYVPPPLKVIPKSDSHKGMILIDKPESGKIMAFQEDSKPNILTILPRIPSTMKLVVPNDKADGISVKDIKAPGKITLVDEDEIPSGMQAMKIPKMGEKLVLTDTSRPGVKIVMPYPPSDRVWAIPKPVPDNIDWSLMDVADITSSSKVLSDTKPTITTTTTTTPKPANIPVSFSNVVIPSDSQSHNNEDNAQDDTNVNSEHLKYISEMYKSIMEKKAADLQASSEEVADSNSGTNSVVSPQQVAAAPHYETGAAIPADYGNGQAVNTWDSSSNLYGASNVGSQSGDISNDVYGYPPQQVNYYQPYQAPYEYNTGGAAAGANYNNYNNYNADGGSSAYGQQQQPYNNYNYNGDSGAPIYQQQPYNYNYDQNVNNDVNSINYPMQNVDSGNANNEDSNKVEIAAEEESYSTGINYRHHSQGWEVFVVVACTLHHLIM